MLAVDFGSPRNTTVYIADTKLDPDDVGTTIVAAPGGMVTTIFLRPKSGNLAPGKKLSTPRDQLSVVVDTGGGARASTSGVDASVKMLTFSGDRVCFSIDYRDDFQRVTGKVRAKLVAPRPN